MKHLALLYHRVNQWKPDPWTLCVSPAHFAEQMQVVSRLSPRPMVTFDDGYADNLQHALPILERYDVPARFFVVSGVLGSPIEMWWDALERLYVQQGSETLDEPSYTEAFERLRPLPAAAQTEQLDHLFSTQGISQEARPERRMLTIDELHALASSPLAEIGAHTVSHPVLSLLPPAQQKIEISQSKASLENLLGRPLRGFAYPNGMAADYTSDTVYAVRDAGFSYAYSAFEHHTDDPFQLPRLMIRDWDGEQFARAIHSANS